MVKKPQTPAEALTALVEGATAKWAKQRKAEERSERACWRRDEVMLYRPRPMSLREAAFRVLPKAFAVASDNGRLPANARQIYYAARPDILAMTGRESLDSQYFCQTLLIDYIREHEVDWDIIWDDRGHFTEPHQGKTIGLGTLSVRRYLRDNSAMKLEEASLSEATIETHGPDGRFGAVLFIEKEGFAPIFEAAALPEKFDIAVMSSKGMSVTAARMLADRMCSKYGIPLLTLHDFDIAGFSIGKTVGSDTQRYVFKNKIRVIDLGLRLADVDEMSLESESVSLGKVEPYKLRARLRRNGATQEEIDFLLSGRRVELNAMPSDQFIEFVERKLTEIGIVKVVPDGEQLADAFRLFTRGLQLQEEFEEAIENLPDDDIAVPDNLEGRAKEYLDENPEVPWEDAVRKEARTAWQSDSGDHTITTG